ncbi:MAG: hypothetical protein Q4A28_09295, partial [Brachymonas sp.]|nr:hypothetical protein [Brachymonas sp.]
RAFVTFVDKAPSNLDFKYHRNLIDEYGADEYIKALNKYFVNYTDEQVAQAFLAGSGLNTVDLEGDGNTDNMAVALAFLKANSTNRVGAILDLMDVLVTQIPASGHPLADVANAYRNKVSVGVSHAINPDSKAALDFGQPGEYFLTDGVDVLTGSARNDIFNAYYNQLNDGDRLDGGAGNDTLVVDIYADKDAITPITKGIENVLFRSQYKGPGKSSDNNLRETKIDAERMKDVINWENYRSRADLLIEDVNINKDQVTKDITITMRDTDPGHVDYGVYFDQLSLRNVASSTSRINIQILDTLATVNNEPNLKGNENWGLTAFNFYASADGTNWQYFSLSGKEITDARTVEEMRDALQKSADAQFGAGVVEVKLGANYVASDTSTGKKVTAKEISIIAKGDLQFDVSNAHATDPLKKAGWSITNLAGNTGLHASWNQNAETNYDLVTSTVVLDNVGRGSTGGDLVIGGMSVGDTSTSQGVGRFEITVEDDSVLRKISSTNDTLQEVTIKNGAQDRNLNAYNPFDKAGGKLVVKGDKAPNTGNPAAIPPVVDPTDVTLPGGSTSEYGFQDVRLIDGSAMTGMLEFNAEITQNAVDKYLKLRDTQPDPKAEDIAVEYTGGANNDKMWVNVNQVAVTSNSKINPGKADFSFKFDGGKGNDTINVAIDRAVDGVKVADGMRGESKFKTDITGFDVIQAGDTEVLKGGNEAWYHNQRSNGRDRFELNGGEGNDFIVKPGAGDTVIKAGVGADVVFADNTGALSHNAGLDAEGNPIAVLSKAGWAFNTFGNLLTTDPLYNADALKVTDTKALTQKTVGSWGFKVKVNYRGLESEEIAIDDLGDFKTNQLEINQAIKKAINDDAVLSKLLVAQDGPGTSLFVQSKVDGFHNENALSISLIAPPAASVSQEVVDAYNQANGTTLTTANFLTTITANVDNAYAQGYETKLAKDALGINLEGERSFTTSDNRIHPGVDDDVDVLVLGTTEASLPTVGAVNALLAAFATAVDGVPVNGSGIADDQRNDTADILETGKTWADRAEIETDLSVGFKAAVEYVKADLGAATPAGMVAAFDAAIAAQLGGTVFGAGEIRTALTAIAALPATDKAAALAHLEAVVSLSLDVLAAAADTTHADAAAVNTAVDEAVDAAAQAAALDKASHSVLSQGLSAVGELYSSNDTVVFEGAFGKDVIVNFQLGWTDWYGHDKLDFTALGGKSSGFVTGVAAIGGKGGQVVTDGNIQLFNYVKTAGNNPANDTMEKVKELYTDGTPAAIAKEIYIAVDGTTGTGHVYQVIDGTAANDLQVNFLGTLDLSTHGASTTNFDWNVLSAYNFA